MSRNQSGSRLMHSSSSQGRMQQQEAWGEQGGSQGDLEELVVARRVVRREDKYRAVTGEKGAVLHSVQAWPLRNRPEEEEEDGDEDDDDEKKRRKKRSRLRRRKTSGVGALDRLDVGGSRLFPFAS